MKLFISHLGSRQIRHFAHAVGLLLAVALLAGCANLTAVRDFAAQSKSLASYQAIPADMVNTNVRRQALYGKEEADSALKEYKDYQKLFEERQAVLVKYMGALAAVADNEVINYEANLTEVAGAATKAGVLEKSDADLFASIANLAAKVATDGARRKLLRDIVVRCDPAVQKLAGALAETVSLDYIASLNREGQAADSLRMDASRDPGLNRLARYTLSEHTIDLAERKKAASAYAEALKKIAEGHGKLAAHIEDFSAKEFVAELKGYQDELKALQNQLKN